jgi:hypothetical protein
MATNSQYLNGQLSDAQIEQLIQSLSIFGHIMIWLLFFSFVS